MRHFAKILRMSVAGGVAIGCVSTLDWAAMAQEPDPNTSVSQRFNPDFSAKGIPLGAFRMFPSVQVGGTYDSNIFATEDDEEDDLIATIRPTINLRSEFVRHRLNFEAGGDLGYHLDNTDDDYEDLFIGANGILEIRRGSELTGAIRYDLDHEDRSSPDDGGANNDISRLDRLQAGIAFRQQFNRVFGQIGLDAVRTNFGAQRNADRDRNEYSPTLRVGYELSEQTNLFVEGEYRMVRYDDTPDNEGFDRNSDGYGAFVGAEFDITGVLFGAIQAGFTSTTYDDGDLDDATGFSGGGQLTWNVTELTSIIGSLDAGIRETTVEVDGETASGNQQIITGLGVEHELRRNVILDGNIGYRQDNFEGTDRTDDTLFAGAGVRYLLSRNLSLDGNYRFSTRSSDVDTAEFDRHTVFVGATARF